MREEIRAIVSGQVQTVMYRDFVQRTAKKSDIVGFARNLPDGTVEVVAQGLPDSLKKFIEQLHEGSPLSRVDSVYVLWKSSRSRYEDFRISH